MRDVKCEQSEIVLVQHSMPGVDAFSKQMQTLLDIIADVMEVLSFGSSTSWRDIDDESRIVICVCLVVAAIGLVVYFHYY